MTAQLISAFVLATYTEGNNLAICDNAIYISDLFTKWEIIDFCQVGVSFGVSET